MSALLGRLAAAMARPPRADAAISAADDYDDAAPDPASLIPAAVLVAVTDRAEPGVILTRRTATLRSHPGQVAFPGGRLDPGEDAVAAALREAMEEVALDPAQVIVAGTADPYRTGTGYLVTPVLGVIPADAALVPAEAEVAAVFEVPLAYLVDPANRARRSAHWRGRERHYWEIGWGSERIWGATAAMIVNLAERLR